MTDLEQLVPPSRRRGILYARRLTLLTTAIAGLGAAAVLVPAGAAPGTSFFSAPALAQNLSDEAKRAARGWLGVQIQPMTPEIAESMGLKTAEGALIAEPQPNSPATKAGLQAGDVIASVDGTPIKDARELARKIGDMKPGSEIKLSVIRKGAEQTMTATLAEMPGQQAARPGSDRRDARSTDEPRIGLMVASAATAGAGDQGVIVTSVDPNGIAAGQGFNVGDVILEVGGRAVKTPEEMRKALADARGGDKKNVLMRVKSGEVTKFVAVPLARA